MIHDLGVVGILDDHVGLGKSLLDIALPVLLWRRRFPFSWIFGAPSARASSRGNHRKRAVPDADGLDGLLRDLLGFGGHKRHGIPAVPHMLPDEGLLVLESDAEAVTPGMSLAVRTQATPFMAAASRVSISSISA